MIELSPQTVTIVMLAGVMLAVFSGYYIGVSIGAVGLILGYLMLGDAVFDLIYIRLFHLLANYILVAVPLFIFMGFMLESSGITEKMYDALYLWLGGLRGGLAIATVIMGTMLAACVGVIGASVTTLTVVALPAMIKRGYIRSLACGAVCAGGSLGVLIPPSIMLVVYGPMAQVSVGKLFLAAFAPGLILSALYCSYILIRSFLQPEVAPAVPPSERLEVSFIKKTSVLIIAIVPVGLLILAVLGTIFLGIAPPTEAAGIGALAATILVIAYRRFSLQVLKKASVQTLRVTSMVLLIASLAYSFCGVFLSAGGGKVVQAVLLDAPGGRWGVFAVVMFLFFILGFLVDWLGIFFIIIPIIAPLAPTLGFDPIWFGLMICINLQMSFMTPPFAPAIFYVRGSVAPELGVTMGDIIRGVIPFVFLIIVTLGLCTAFPQIILWLPSQMIK